jgi:hypothetical protein
MQSIMHRLSPSYYTNINPRHSVEQQTHNVLKNHAMLCLHIIMLLSITSAENNLWNNAILEQAAEQGKRRNMTWQTRSSPTVGDQ